MSEPSNDEKPEVNSHVGVKEYVKEKSKATFKFTIGGATIMMIFGVIGFIGSRFGMQGLSIQTAGDIMHALQIRDGYAVLWLVSAVLMLFGFILIWAKFEHRIGLMLHEKSEMALESQSHDVKKLKRIRVIPKILFGIILTILIPTGASVYQEMTSTNLSDLEGMKDAFLTLSLPAMASYIVGFASVGFFTYYLIKKFPDFEKRLGKKLGSI